MLKKTALLLFVFLGSSSLLFAGDCSITNTAIGNGIGIGSALAVAICWSRTHSVFTAALAGLFGWFYVFYYLLIIKNTEEEEED